MFVRWRDSSGFLYWGFYGCFTGIDRELSVLADAIEDSYDSTEFTFLKSGTEKPETARQVRIDRNGELFPVRWIFAGDVIDFPMACLPNP